jgi:hypothetical protein
MNNEKGTRINTISKFKQDMLDNEEQNRERFR